MIIVKRCLLAVIMLVLLSILALFVMLWSARVETTQNRVHTRLLLPVGTGSAVGIHIYAGTGDTPMLPGFLDGPVIQRVEDGQWQAKWFCEDRVFQRKGAAATLQIDCAGGTHTYPTQALSTQSADVVAMPARMLVLSDIEGNARFLDAALRELGVMDSAGGWTYGTDRLVIAGDAVDRGRDVFAVLWRLHKLGIEARKRGGDVHVLLGNHEQYMLLGNLSRAHREHIHGLQQLGGQRRAFAANTVLGSWLRHQPVIIQVGKILITHGGIGPAVAASELTVPQLNDAMRRYWDGAPASKIELESVIGLSGLSQYRGYFEAVKDRYPKARMQDVIHALSRFGADTVVVGHTGVERITPLYDGRVQAINVNSVSAQSEALLFEDGIARVVPLESKRNLAEPVVRSRPLRLSQAQDWRLLRRAVESNVALARLPFPY